MEHNPIKEAFAPVRADEALLQSTAQFLRREREKRLNRRSGVLARPRILAAAFALLLVLSLSGYRWYQVPGAYVSIDVNPSVELTLNRMGRVAETYAFNAEGEQILASLDLRGKSYGEAVAQFLSAVESEGYLPDDSLVALSIQAGAKQEARLSAGLADAVHRQLAASGIAAEVEVFPVARQVRQEAHACHMSPAKYLAIQELLEADAEASLEEYSHHSIQDIRTRTRECMEGHSGNGQAHHGNRQGGRNRHTSRQGR